MNTQIPSIDFNHPHAQWRTLITGGPGFGITSTINALNKMGYATVKEAARFVIERELAKVDSEVLPWKNRGAFDRAILKVKLEDYLQAPNEQPVFFDRGLPDFVGWSRYYDKSYEPFVPSIQMYPFNRRVFLTVPWKEIYVQNEQRPMPFEDAQTVHEYLVKAYEDMGFEIIYLEKSSPEERATQILKQLGLA